MDFIPLSWNKSNRTDFLDTLMKFWVPWNAGDFLADQRRTLPHVIRLLVRDFKLPSRIR